MRFKKGLAAVMAALCLIGMGWHLPDVSASDTPPDLQNARIVMENQSAGNSNVLIPKLEGHPDAQLQTEINARIAERLQTEACLRTLERVREWGGDEEAGSGIHMLGRAQIMGGILSMAVSVQGELPDGSIGQIYLTFNCDLFTGQDVTLGDLFVDPEAAFEHMGTLVTEQTEREGMNSYLEQGETLPVPRDAFSIDERGVTVYYPNSQFRLLSGTSGAFVFLFYQLEPFMQQSPLCEQLLALRPAPEDPAEQVRRNIAEGWLPGAPARLNAPIQQYIDQYRPPMEPDYTLDGPLYLFESPLMQGVGLISPMYPEDGTLGPVITIRASLIDLYGLRPGVSTLEDAVSLLGEPDQITMLDEGTAFDMILPAGQSYWYASEGNQMQLHADETGMLIAVLLHTGAQGA